LGLRAGDEPDRERDHELAHLLLNETREEMQKADQKAVLMLSALGAMVVALLAVATGGASLRDYAPAAQTLFWVGCAAWVPALIASGLAVLPRTGSPQQGRAHYFGDVTRTDSVTLLGEIVHDTDPLVRDLDQLAALSRVVME
jgi:hypothetical protein